MMRLLAKKKICTVEIYIVLMYMTKAIIDSRGVEETVVFIKLKGEGCRMLVSGCAYQGAPGDKQ
jgi:hypothetical protein